MRGIPPRTYKGETSVRYEHDIGLILRLGPCFGNTHVGIAQPGPGSY